MSLQTWIKEFCPIRAQATKQWSDEHRVIRDLLKWEGLRAPAIAKHRVTIEGRWVVSAGRDECFDVAKECGLCAKYGAHRRGLRCHGCPLAILRRGVRCDQVHGIESASPWARWWLGGDPEPMIRLLEKALKREQAT